MLDSNYKKLCEVVLPYNGRQMYMHTFDLAKPIMAYGFEDYLIPVLTLCAAAGATSGIAHMTVDEKTITAGISQRRPKPHVDGCFYPEKKSWGHEGGWLHGCNNIKLQNYSRMAVIVAASAIGCRAWQGKFDVEPKGNGDLSHFNFGHGEILPPNIGYLLSPDCVHESMIQEFDIKRTFLRIALPTEFDFNVMPSPI